MNENENPFSLKNRECINYRFVVNDAVCHPWIPDPEIGKTLKELVAWLEKCSHTCDRLGKKWDYRRLRPTGRDAHILDYGMRGQFWLPRAPGANEFTWLKEESMQIICPCGNTIEPDDDWEEKSVCPDTGWILWCSKCGRHTATRWGSLAATAQDAVKIWKLFFG